MCAICWQWPLFMVQLDPGSFRRGKFYYNIKYLLCKGMLGVMLESQATLREGLFSKQLT